MALHRMGLGAEFTLNTSQAVKSSNTARQSIGNLRQGLTQLSLAAAPVAIAMGAMVKSAAGFNKQMSAVEAVSGASSGEMGDLRKQAKMMALDTKFSSTEAADGMEVLSRAGFSVAEAMTALRPVMDTAAADNMELAAAADVVASSIRGMGLEASDAARVADVLAKASASSNTNVTMIGDSMRYAQSQAKIMGIDLETVVSVIGALGDAGLKGSIAGTSFANMLKKMAKPSTAGVKLMQQYGVGIKNFADGSVDVLSTLKTLRPALEKMSKAQERAAFIAEIFGIRGQKAVSAISTSIEKGRFELLHEKLMNANGAAKEMAEIQLDNTIGQFTKLHKAVGVLATEIFDPFLSSMKGAFSGLHGHLTNVLKAAIEINNAQDDIDVEGIRQKYGVYAEIALGIQDAANAIKDAFDTVTGAFGKAGDKFKEMFGEDGLRTFTKYAIIIGVVVAALVPLALGIVGVSMALGGLKAALMAIGSIVLGLNPWVLAIVGVFALLVTLTDGWGALWTGLSTGISTAIEQIREAINGAVEDISSAISGVRTETTGMTVDWELVGTVIVGVISSVATAVITIVGKLIAAVAGTFSNILKWFQDIGASFAQIVDGWLDIFRGDFLSGIKKIFGGLFNLIMAPIRAVARQIVLTAKTVGLEGLVPQGLADFAEGGARRVIEKGASKRGVPKIKKQKRGAHETPTQRLARERKNKKAGEASSFDIFEGKFANALDGVLGKKLDTIANNTAADQTTEVCIDGRKVAKATNKHRQIDKERGGGSEQWQRRRALQTTAV